MQYFVWQVGAFFKTDLREFRLEFAAMELQGKVAVKGHILNYSYCESLRTSWTQETVKENMIKK